MELLYAGIFDAEIKMVAEVVRDSAVRERALEQVATYTGSTAEARKITGLQFTFSPCSGDCVAVLVSRGQSPKILAQLQEAVSKIGPSARAPAGKAALQAVVERYVGDARLLAGGKLDSLDAHLTRLKDAAVSNVEQLLERGEKIEVLVSRTDQLAASTSTFKRSARVLERSTRWRDRKGWACLCVIILLKLAFLYFLFVRGSSTSAAKG